jgi:hypothetical protein
MRPVDGNSPSAGARNACDGETALTNACIGVGTRIECRWNVQTGHCAGAANVAPAFHYEMGQGGEWIEGVVSWYHDWPMRVIAMPIAFMIAAPEVIQSSRKSE